LGDVFLKTLPYVITDYKRINVVFCFHEALGFFVSIRV